MDTGDTETPRFGLVDLVDAFTAFRHEYRTQVKESRALHDLLESLVQKLEQFGPSSASQPNSELEVEAKLTQRWVMVLIDFDIQWTRAIEAVVRYEEISQQETARVAARTAQAIAALSPWQRWWSGALIRQLQEPASLGQAPKGSMAEGLMILLSRVRNLLEELRIERIETIGKSFDGELMRSIGTIVDANVPVGAVAQQLSPAYRWNGVVVKFADVRVSVVG